MECEKICEQICSYLDNEMDTCTKTIFEEHIYKCDKCNEEMKACKCIKSRVKDGLNSIKTPEFLKKKIIYALKDSDNYRESGIDALDLIHWGSHIAQLCENKHDLKEILVPYIKSGLEQNEKCLWVTSELSVLEAIDSVSQSLKNIDSLIDKGQLEILSYNDWYLCKGYFDGKAVIDTAFKKYEDAISKGYSGLRLAGNACWLEPDDWNAYINLEELVNNSLSDEKIIVLCSYKQNGCTKDRMYDVINHHKHVLCKQDNSWKLKTQCLDD